MNLVFATNNPYKLHELRQILEDIHDILSLHDVGCKEEVPETGTTLESNSLEKAMYVFKKYKVNCFADDTGLEVDALSGEPGVYSARYAGDQKKPLDNMKKVLEKMVGKTNRKARFRCVISLIIDGKVKQFEGIVEGIILHEPQGDGGFGYDPIFLPDDYNVSFAEMPLDLKNLISHRGRAVHQLVEYLQNI